MVHVLEVFGTHLNDVITLVAHRPNRNVCYINVFVYYEASPLSNALVGAHDLESNSEIVLTDYTWNLFVSCYENYIYIFKNKPFKLHIIGMQM